MAIASRLGATGRRRAGLGAAVAGLGTFAYYCLGWLSLRTGPPSFERPFWTFITATVGVLFMLAVGVASGLVSGRQRDAAASWAAAVIGATLGTQAMYTIDPTWPSSEDGLWGALFYGSIVLLPFIIGGHMLGAWSQLASHDRKAKPALIAAPLILILVGLAVTATVAINTPAHPDMSRPASPAEIAAALNVKDLPAEIGGLPLADTSIFEPATGGRNFFAVWSEGVRQQIQVSLYSGVSNEAPAYVFDSEAGQVSFMAREGDSSLEVFAPDLASLRAAVAAIRPALTAQLEHEIAHPWTPNP